MGEQMTLKQARAVIDRHEWFCGNYGPIVGFLSGNRDGPICTLRRGHAGAHRHEDFRPHRDEYQAASATIEAHEEAELRAKVLQVFDDLIARAERAERRVAALEEELEERRQAALERSERR